MPIRIAALLTSHNRCNQTYQSLKMLFAQRNIDSIELDVFLVDSDSSDGTPDMIYEHFPQINLICRDDSYYWCNGMRTAFAAAAEKGYDYYLWLNDDTILNADSLDKLLETDEFIRERTGRDGITVGSTFDPESGNLTYGGLKGFSRFRPLAFEKIQPSDEPQICDSMNGNCVLIPHKVFETVGNLSANFTHSIGDIDYGLRAKASGIPIWTIPGYAGICPQNNAPRWDSKEVPLFRRLKILHSPKGLPPSEWFVYTKRHGGIRCFLHLFFMYLRVLFPVNK